MNEVDIDRFLERLREFDAIRESDTINRGTVDRIKPTHADEWPRQLNPAVRDALVAAGIGRHGALQCVFKLPASGPLSSVVSSTIFHGAWSQRR